MRHAAHVAHHSRGRLRIRVPSAKGNKSALETIRKSLTCVEGVKTVTVNDVIGTVTIEYDPRHHANFEQHLASQECPQDTVTVVSPPSLEQLEEVDAMIAHEAMFLAQHSQSAKAIIDWFHAVDQSVRRMTDNAIDLKVLAPLVLAAGIFLELGVNASTPVWLTMGLFSFNHFVELHTKPPSGGPRVDPPRQPERRS